MVQNRLEAVILSSIGPASHYVQCRRQSAQPDARITEPPVKLTCPKVHPALVES